ncbi:MAG: hypothetical protein ABIQ03_10235 [Burkholderiales bacterium]
MNHISRRRFIRATGATPLLATLSGRLAFRKAFTPHAAGFIWPLDIKLL